MAKSTSRSIYLDQTAAEVALEKLNKQVEKLESTIKRGTKAGKDMTAEIAKLDKAKAGVDELKNAIDKGLRPSLVQQKELVRNLRNELSRMSEDAPRYAEKFSAYKNATAELNRMKTAMDGTAKAQASWLSNAKSIALGVVIGNTVQAALQSISSYLSGLLQGNAKLSDELADIEKTSGLSSSAVATLNSELSKLDTRTSSSNLREIAIGLGQIGEAVTPENVAAIDKIVVALGDEFGGGAKEITTVLSVLRNNLQDIKTGNYGDDVARIGNALNVLGAEGLATAPIVTDFANRMAGVAGTFGLTSGQILGTAATFQELGINVERGSTAFVKILQKIAAEPKKFADVAGVSITEFTKLVNEDLLAAFLKVAEGARVAGKDNVTFGKILKDLDADGSGAGEVLSKVAVNAQLLSDKVNLAGNALKNTNSITEEFNKKNTTLGAEYEKAIKRISSLFAGGSISESLKKLIFQFNQLTAPVKTAVQQFDELDKKVKNLDTNITPLINRYDVLSSKTKLSSAEQAEMKSIVEQVAGTIPSAITQVDAYGNAIAISTDRVRDYIATEKDRLKVVNEAAINELERTIKEVNKQFDFLDKRIQERNAKGFFGVQIRAEDGTTFTRKSSEAELRELDANYQAIISKRNGLNAELKRKNGEALQETIDAAAKERAAREKQLAEERKRQSLTLGGGGTTKEDPRKKLLEELRQLQLEVENVGKTGDEKELNRIRIKYAKLIEEAKAYADITIELEALRNKEVGNLIAEITRKQAEEHAKQEQQEKEKTEKLRDELMRRKEAELNVARQNAPALLARINEEAINKKRLQVLQTWGEARLNAELELLEEEERQAIIAADGREDKIAVIEEEYRQRKAQMIFEFYQARISEILNYTQQALQVIDTFFQAQSNRENARLQKDIRQNDQRRAAFKRLLDQRLISEAEYNRRVQALNEEDDKKKRELQKKQFNRQKGIQIAQAYIGGALAAIQSVSNTTLPFPLSLIGPVLIAAMTAANIGVIASQKPPEYAKGGIAQGGRHSEGGIDLYDRKSKRVVGNIEGGEPIMVLSRNTYANNADVVDELLDASMNRGGERIRPGRIRRFWETRPYQSFNYSGATTALRKRYFETGGVIAAGNTAAAAEDNAANSAANETLNEMKQVMLFMADTVNRLSATLDRGIEANVSLKKFRDAETLDAQIKADGTMKP